MSIQTDTDVLNLKLRCNQLESDLSSLRAELDTLRRMVYGKPQETQAKANGTRK